MMPLAPSLLDSYRVVGFDQRGTGGSGLLRCRALERDPRLRSVARRRGVRAPARRGAAALHDAGLRRGPRGDPRRARRRAPDAVRHLLRDRAGARLRPRAPRPRRPADPRLRRRPRRPRPVRARRLPRDGPEPRRAVPGRLPRRLARADRARGEARRAAARARRCAGSSYDRRGRRHAQRIGPTAIADLLFDSDYNPPLRAAVPAAVKAALRGDAAPLARLVAEGDGLAELPVAEVVLQRPLRDRLRGDAAAVGRLDAARPTASARPGGARRSSAPAAFFPFDLTTAAADEIGLCLHWPGVPSGRVAGARGAVSGRADAAAAGRRGPAHAARGLRARGARRSRARSAWPCRAWATRWSAATRAAAACARSSASSRGEPAGGDCRRVGHGRAGHGAAAADAARVAPLRGLRGRVGRTAAAIGVTVDDLAFSLSPAFLAYSGGGLRGGIVRRAARARDRAALLGRARDVDLAASPGAACCACGSAAGPRRTGGSRCARAAGVSGRLGGRRVRVRLPGYGGASLARAGVGAPRARRWRACSARLSSRSLHARVWFRHPRADSALVPSGCRPHHGRQP